MFTDNMNIVISFTNYLRSMFFLNWKLIFLRNITLLVTIRSRVILTIVWMFKIVFMNIWLVYYLDFNEIDYRSTLGVILIVALP